MILELDKLPNLGIFGTEGSGNQIKCWVTKGESRYLIKINSKHREASKEVSVSKFLDVVNIPHAQYNEITVIYKGAKRNACITKSFIQSGECSAPIYNYLSIDKYGHKLSSQEVFNQVVLDLSVNTGINANILSTWIKTCMTIDYIVINPDRHFTNMEIISSSNGSARVAPLYDFGQSFLNRDSMMPKTQFKGMEQKFKTKPFSSNQNKNLIDIKFSQELCRMINSKMREIDNLDIPDFHKFVIKYRVDKILSMK